MRLRLHGLNVEVLQKLEASGNRIVGYRADGRKSEFQLNDHKIIQHVDTKTEERRFFMMFKPKVDTLYMVTPNGHGSLIFGEKKPLFGKKEMHVLVSSRISAPIA